MIAATLAGGTLVSCSSESSTDNAESKEHANSGYQCPMKCEGKKVYEEPGDCPVCGMDLEK